MGDREGVPSLRTGREEDVRPSTARSGNNEGLVSTERRCGTLAVDEDIAGGILGYSGKSGVLGRECMRYDVIMGDFK
jgi:hypothetical protein